jgi:hypothetical protein
MSPQTEEDTDFDERQRSSPATQKSLLGQNAAATSAPKHPLSCTVASSLA